MSEPEFLPEWYRVRLRRSRRRRAIARATVALSLLATGAVALSPGRAPAVVTEDVGRTTSDSRATAAGRRAVPTDARRALRALHDLIPTGVEVSAVTFRNDAGVTTMELHCAGEHLSAAEELIGALRRSRVFTDVRLTPAPSVETSSPARNEVSLFNVRLSVVPPEAP